LGKRWGNILPYFQ